MHYPFVNIHTHGDDRCEVSIFSHSIGEGYPTPLTPYSAGIHPWAVNRVDIEASISILQRADIVAVGEIGLDFAVKDADRQTQTMVFERQLAIAEQRQLPVIVHCVRAVTQTLEILGRYTLPSVIFHSFIGSGEQVKDIVNAGYYISLSDRSLNSLKTVAAIPVIPLEKLFLETDASTVSIEGVYVRMAEISAIPLDILREQLYKNYKTILLR